MSADSVPETKIVLVGAQGVGKTCIVSRAITGQFDPSVKATVGACYACKLVEVKDKTIKLQIWDTAGQERYKNMVPMYYRNARIAVVVFSVIDELSLEAVDFWVNSVNAGTSPQPALFIVGNKIDCEAEQRKITTEQGKEMAAKFDAEYFEVSALTGKNIEEMMQRMGEVALKKVEEDEQQSNNTTVIINPGTRPGKVGKPKPCCQ